MHMLAVLSQGCEEYGEILNSLPGQLAGLVFFKLVGNGKRNHSDAARSL